jgi:acylphosphatase
MFQIGDLVEYFVDYQENETKLVGFVENVVDGNVTVKWLNYSERYITPLIYFIKPLEFLRKVDKVEERGIK